MTKELLKTAEQDVYISISGNIFKLRLYTFKNLMYIDVQLAGEYVTVGKRVVQNRWVLPTYMSNEYGNFRFETYVSDKNDYVWYDGFNEKFVLSYYTSQEIEQMK